MNRLVTVLRCASRPWQRAALALLAATALLPAQDARGPELPPGCEALNVPAGNIVSLHVYAQGAQIYRWNAATSTWTFVAPAALLFADAGGTEPIGAHFAGPTWITTSGSSVVGTFAAGATVDPTAIPWLKLSAVASEGPGPLMGTTFIQRVNTTGGRAPARAGAPDEVVWIPYTAEYWFYRAR